jgi:hypothetical protein
VLYESKRAGCVGKMVDGGRQAVAPKKLKAVD